MLRLLRLLGRPILNAKRSFLGDFESKILQFLSFLCFFSFLNLISLKLLFIKAWKVVSREITTFMTFV